MKKIIFDHENLVSIIDLSKKFSKLDKNISMQAVGIFAYVCIYEGTTSTDLANYFNLTKARTSRWLQILSSVSRTRISGVGLGLIQLKEDPNDFRKKNLHLTNKGKELKESLIKY
ncbi:hypothetical protein OAJ40_01710 [Candidatus Pelagibacter sp.]|nr:hypothetical protein [Candidatus Pelagibacter sp.]